MFRKNDKRLLTTIIKPVGELMSHKNDGQLARYGCHHRPWFTAETSGPSSTRRQTSVHSKWLTTDAFAILLPKAAAHYLNIETWNQTNLSIYFSQLFAFQISEALKIFMLFDSVTPLAGIIQGNNSKQ